MAVCQKHKSQGNYRAIVEGIIELVDFT